MFLFLNGYLFCPLLKVHKILVNRKKPLIFEGVILLLAIVQMECRIDVPHNLPMNMFWLLHFV